MAIYDEIKAERDYQDKRWGHKMDDTVNTPWMWTAYVALYASKWMVGSCAPLGATTVGAFRARMVKTAAICVAAVESIDRQRAADGKTFYE